MFPLDLGPNGVANFVTLDLTVSPATWSRLVRYIELCYFSVFGYKMHILGSIHSLECSNVVKTTESFLTNMVRITKPHRKLHH